MNYGLKAVWFSVQESFENRLVTGKYGGLPSNKLDLLLYHNNVIYSTSV